MWQDHSYLGRGEVPEITEARKGSPDYVVYLFRGMVDTSDCFPNALPAGFNYFTDKEARVHVLFD